MSPLPGSPFNFYKISILHFYPSAFSSNLTLEFWRQSPFKYNHRSLTCPSSNHFLWDGVCVCVGELLRVFHLLKDQFYIEKRIKIGLGLSAESSIPKFYFIIIPMTSYYIIEVILFLTYTYWVPDQRLIFHCYK